MARILGRLVAKATYWTKRRNSTATTRRSRYSTEWWGVSQKSSYTLMAKEHILSNKGARSLNYNEKNIQAVIVCRFGAQSSNSQGRSFPVSLSSVVLPCLPSHCVFSGIYAFWPFCLSVSKFVEDNRKWDNLVSISDEYKFVFLRLCLFVEVKKIIDDISKIFGILQWYSDDNNDYIIQPTHCARKGNYMWTTW